MSLTSLLSNCTATGQESAHNKPGSAHNCEGGRMTQPAFLPSSLCYTTNLHYITLVAPYWYGTIPYHITIATSSTLWRLLVRVRLLARFALSIVDLSSQFFFPLSSKWPTVGQSTTISRSCNSLCCALRHVSPPQFRECVPYAWSLGHGNGDTVPACSIDFSWV